MSLNSPTPPLPARAPGSLTHGATVTFDTTGFSTGRWDFLLTGTRGGNSTELLSPTAESLPLTITNGELVIVPEPSVTVLVLAGLGLILRRRSRN